MEEGRHPVSNQGGGGGGGCGRRVNMGQGLRYRKQREVGEYGTVV